MIYAQHHHWVSWLIIAAMFSGVFSLGWWSGLYQREKEWQKKMRYIWEVANEKNKQSPNAYWNGTLSTLRTLSFQEKNLKRMVKEK